MKADNKKTYSTKAIIIISAVTALAFLLTALILVFPKINAEKKLGSIEKLITSEEFDNIIVYQHTPFETGTVEQVSQVLEKKLDKEEKSRLAQLFSDVISKADYTGSSESYYAMTDYKIIITHQNQRTVFYVSNNSVYILNGTLKTSFSCDNNPIYEYLNSIKQSHFEEK